MSSLIYSYQNFHFFSKNKNQNTWPAPFSVRIIFWVKPIQINHIGISQLLPKLNPIPLPLENNLVIAAWTIYLIQSNSFCSMFAVKESCVNENLSWIGEYRRPRVTPSRTANFQFQIMRGNKNSLYLLQVSRLDT